MRRLVSSRSQPRSVISALVDVRNRVPVTSRAQRFCKVWSRIESEAVKIPYDSARARSTKKAVLTSQITRAIRLGSDTAARNRGLEKIRHLFAINGYPNKMIKEHIWKELKKHEERGRGRGRERRERTDQRQRNKKKHGTYIRLPFVNDKVAAQVKKVAINSGLPVEIAWTTNNTLKKRLVKTRLNPPPCPSGRRCCHSCQAGLQSKCTTKNVV